MVMMKLCFLAAGGQAMFTMHYPLPWGVDGNGF
jgi:hypothetical protein